MQFVGKTILCCLLLASALGEAASANGTCKPNIRVLVYH